MKTKAQLSMAALAAAALPSCSIFVTRKTSRADSRVSIRSITAPQSVWFAARPGFRNIQMPP